MANEIEGIERFRFASGAEQLAGAGDPNGVVTSPIGSIYQQTDTAALWQNSDGATAWVAVGSMCQ